MRYIFPIFQKLGGRHQILKLISALPDSRYKNIKVIFMWEDRGIIPRQALLMLMQIAEDLNISYTHNDFLPISNAPS